MGRLWCWPPSCRQGAGWLHAHFLHTPASVTAYAATLAGLDWTCSAHAKDIWTTPEWELREKLAACRWAVACTRVGAERLRRLAPSPDRVHLSYHGIDLSRFPPPERPASRRDGADPADPVIVLSVGRAVDKKGFDVLLHALALLPRRLVWRFIHVGSGELLNTLRDLAAGLGLAGRIEWRGAMSQDEVLERYRAADLFVLASRIAGDGDRDGLPNVVLEAASQRLAVVSTKLPGITEFVRDGETGIVVEPGDPAALAAALERAIGDPALRLRLGAAAEDRRSLGLRPSLGHSPARRALRRFRRRLACRSPDPVTGPRVLFYVQHLLGVGHLVRASRIADALMGDGFEVVLVAGGLPVEGFPGPHVRVAALPALRSAASDFSSLLDARGDAVDQAFLDARRDRLLALAREFRPDVLILEAFPFGRRQMRFELVPLLETAVAMKPKPIIVSSIRDILQENPKPGRRAEVVRLVQEFFDCVLVHGDPNFARLEETFPAAGAIADRVRYTGLVAGPAASPSQERCDVLVSAGGGAAGRKLVETAIAAARSPAQAGRRWRVLTGPNLAADFAQGSGTGTVIESFRGDFPNLLAAAGVSVSQAGYNTVGDVLRVGCRAVLSPFAGAGETEQTARATKLESRNLAEVISEAELDPPSLAAAVERALALPRPAAHGLDLEGARHSARELRRLLALRHDGDAP